MDMRTAYTNESHLDAQQARWFAVYTKYKREKAVFRRLQEKGIETYLPLQQLVRQYTRKTRIVELPLISCYLFARITKQEYVPVLETEGVLDFVNFSGKIIAIPDKEINIVRRLVGEKVELEIEPRRFRPGQEVEIVEGNLTGIRGVLLECYGDKNFLVELNRTGYNLCMHIDPSALRPVRAVPVVREMSTAAYNVAR
jgi:transcription antitermination factor NusG